MQVNGIVQIQAGQHGEDICLQERYQKFESSQRHIDAKRCPAAKNAERNNKAREHLHHRVSGHHVGEQADGKADRPRQIGQNLDGNKHRGHHHRYAAGQEKAEEVQAVAGDGDNRDAQKYEHGHSEGHGNMAGEGKGVGDQADQIGEQDEHEQRKDEREVLATLGADVVANHPGDEFITELGQGLPAAGDQRALAHAKAQENRDRGDRDDHEKAGIGQRRVDGAQLYRHQGLDLKLL